MFQKLSKCEVKARLCWYLIILPPLWFYVKSHFGEFKRSKIVIFGNFRDFEFLENMGLESCTNLLKSKFRTSNIVKINILDCFNSPKLDFAQNWSQGKMIKFAHHASLTSHFDSFWSIVHVKERFEWILMKHLCFAILFQLIYQELVTLQM